MKVRAWLLLVLACSETPATPPPPPIEAQYAAKETSLLTPFPSDRYTVADGKSPTGLRVRIDQATTADTLPKTFPQMVAQLGELDGFSTLAGVTITFSGPLDIRGIAIDKKSSPPILDPVLPPEAYTKPGAPMYLVDVDPGSPQKGTLIGLVPRYWAQDADPDFVADYTIVCEPVTPLRPRTRYLFVATNLLKAKTGSAIVASTETKRMISTPADDYERKVSDAMATFEASSGAKRADVVLATVFTTESVTEGIAGMAKTARAKAAPVQTDPWSVETPVASDNRVRFRAKIEAPEFRDPATKQWRFDNGVLKEQSKAQLEVFLAFADATKSGPRPIVIYQHGLGGDKDGSWGTTERLSSLGAAVIAIDSPEHGSRAPGGSKDSLVMISAFLGIDIDKKSFDIAIARDNFRQTASDQLELVRFINSLGTLDLLPVGAPDGVPDLDVSRVLYIGHSFGSVQGATIFAIAPEITQAVWNVGGANLTVLMRDSPLFSLVLGGLKPPGTSDGLLARFFVVAQALVDPGDPAAFAHYGTFEALDGVTNWKSRDVLIQEVIADNIVPNSCSESLARATGLAQSTPLAAIAGVKPLAFPITGNLSSGATAVISQFDKMDGDNSATHGGLIFSAEARKQYAEFFRTGLANGHATVISGY